MAQQDDGVDKSALSFILDNQLSDEDDMPFSDEEEEMIALQQAEAATPTPRGDSDRRAKRPPSRVCKHDGCDQYVVDQGLCVRHGGGKRCAQDGCESRAKYSGLCWRHGGSVECTVESCQNRAKSRGLCWSHGGGTKCKVPNCNKVAISNGLCWADGGGKRCIRDDCNRQAYERTDNYCKLHFKELQQSQATSNA